ncbi:alpha/beta fold hydrolase [Cupriavidus numazuensis]|uniref:2-hydroxy-6-oxo-2,4-heptadienoate hydrolase n=1 Tax=Cupriavidus numazuensis TaxID=221992 RepID=A0ABM8TLY2_9BURK|nr:alpha/beta fold hydrolase [Cupriavidus numazuensis]CAG2153884.1 2-hydroxy-6-oxo-2,4-heptadienoate hydrolase [Cupriavidus numazuensis]
MQDATATSKDPEIGRSVRAAGIVTNYHDEGSGRPVLLIHGSGPGVTAWANWRLTLPALAQSCRPIAPDIVGFGYTERPDSARYGRELWLQHLVGFMDALDLSEVDVIGNSFGGALALWLATNHPERVRKMVLMGSVGVPFELTAGLDAVWGYQPSRQNMHDLLRTFAYDHSLLSDTLAESRFQASVRPGYQETFSQMFPAPRQRSIEALAVPDGKLSALQQPTLIVHGREDRVIPTSTSERLFSLIPNAELHMFPGCGHWVQIEKAARFNQLVTDFLAS